MTSTELITPSASEHRTVGEALAELVPLVGAIAGEGPPVILVAGPWLLFVLMLSGPFAFLVTLVVAMLAVAALVIGLAAAIVAAPYLLIRRLRAPSPIRDDRAPRLVPVGPTRAAA